MIQTTLEKIIIGDLTSLNSRVWILFNQAYYNFILVAKTKIQVHRLFFYGQKFHL